MSGWVVCALNLSCARFNFYYFFVFDSRTIERERDIRIKKEKKKILREPLALTRDLLCISNDLVCLTCCCF